MVGQSIINYAAPVWSSNLHDVKSNIHRMRLWGLPLASTRCPVSITCTLTLKVKEHSDQLSAQYLDRFLESDIICQSIITRGTPKRQMKETLFIRRRNTVEPMRLANDMKSTLPALHNDAVTEYVNNHERNAVLDDRLPPINNSEKYLTRKEHAALAQLRSRYCGLLGSNFNIILFNDIIRHGHNARELLLSSIISIKNNTKSSLCDRNNCRGI